MTVATVRKPQIGGTRRGLPPLHSGDRLSRAEFHRRYAAHPDIKKAELVEGVVYVSSPVTLPHSEAHARMSTLLGFYSAHTPGVRLADNQTVILDNDNELQPDLCVWLPTNKRVMETEDGLLVGAPDLVVEIAASSAAYDLHDKLHVYRRSGVQEYLILLVYEEEVRWLRWDEGTYTPLQPDASGVFRSQLLPGFCLRPDLFWSGAMTELLALLQTGLATAAHRAFVSQLRSAG